MNRFVASIAGLAAMTTASLASADCISTCEANCLFGDPGQIGLCIASCPATCAVPLEPPCVTTGGTNTCSTTAVVVTPQGASGFRFTNDNSGGSAKAFMTLSCKEFPNSIKTVFKGSKTINPGGSSFQACKIGTQLVGNAFSSTCGRANTCSGGVN